MAALLCQSLCKMLGDCTSCVAYPCKACCECTGKMLCSPFVPYLTVTMAFNVPLVLWGYETIKQSASHCDKVWWLWMNALMAIGHVIGSMYIVYRIQRGQLNPYNNEPYDDYYDDEVGHSKTKNRVKAKPIAAVLPNNRNHYTKQYPDDPSISPYEISDDENSRKPLYKKSIVPAVDSEDAMKYQNLDNPEVRAYPVTSPKSVHSATTSPFRDLFGSNKSANTTGNQTHSNDPNNGKIESVASMIAGISDSPDDGPSNSFHRLGHVLCYDPGVAIYFFVAALWVIWQSVGVTVVISLAGDNDDDDQCQNINRWIGLSIMCGFLYMMLVLCAFGCSLLCLR